MEQTQTPTAAPELLAPAGDWDALRAAVANGADAVYFGLGQFNARHRATNFQEDELPGVIAYLHRHNVRGFLTFNTLIFSDELPAAADYIRRIAAAGVDAVIVQDLGLVRLIKAMAPGIHVHASTQMTLSEPRGIALARRLGVERVVLPRELSMPEIGRITAAMPDMPVEVFIHGALCVAYSGQCLTSESIGGRSANRGQCAQACRLPYDLFVDGRRREMDDLAYLLSPQDLAAYDLIGELVGLGVRSFKIEGRLKSAHYVAAATQTYRAALDAAKQHAPFQIDRQQELDLAQSFSRGFSHGFLSGVDHQTLVQGRFPKSRGVRVGTVTGVTERGVVVELAAGIPGLNAGDGLVFDEGHPEQDEQGGRVFSVEKTLSRKRELEVIFGRGQISLRAVAAGAAVWKTDDPAVRKRLEQSFNRDVTVRRVPVNVTLTARVGSPPEVVLFDDAGNSGAITGDQPLEKAMKHPLSLDVVREQFARLGDTPYELAGVELVGDDGPGTTVPAMIPKSVLNDLRRRVVDALTASREATHRAPLRDGDALTTMRNSIKARSAPQPDSQTPSLHVLVRTLAQLDAVLDWSASELPGAGTGAMVYCDFDDPRKYRDAVAKARAAGVPIGLATVRIIKPGEEGLLRQVADCGPDAVLVRNLAAVTFFAEQHPGLTRIGDYSLNVANELTAELFADLGLTRIAPSYDLNWKQLQAMIGRIDPGLFEAVIHQHMPMFHMEHCVFAHTLSEGRDHRTCGRPCDEHRMELRDRTGVEHPVTADVGCRNTVFNGQAQSALPFVDRMMRLGLRHYRVELLRENADDVGGVLDRYSAVLAGRADPRKELRSLNVLSQLGVTPGTLDFE